jgi:hypothetical protein
MRGERIYLDDNEVSFDKLDFKWAVIRHIDRIGNLCSFTQTEKQASLEERQKLITLSVKLFEQCLMPYQDDKYELDIGIGQELLAEGKELAFALHKFGCLMMLLHRRGFLMVGYSKGFGGDRDIAWEKKRQELKQAKEQQKLDNATPEELSKDITLPEE